MGLADKHAVLIEYDLFILLPIVSSYIFDNLKSPANARHQSCAGDCWLALASQQSLGRTSRHLCDFDQCGGAQQHVQVVLHDPSAAVEATHAVRVEREPPPGGRRVQYTPHIVIGKDGLATHGGGHVDARPVVPLAEGESLAEQTNERFDDFGTIHVVTVDRLTGVNPGTYRFSGLSVQGVDVELHEGLLRIGVARAFLN